jgi:hypothetical protein
MKAAEKAIEEVFGDMSVPRGAAIKNMQQLKAFVEMRLAALETDEALGTVDESEPYRGSLDPFEDIVDQLDKVKVAYFLMVGMTGNPVTSVWSNAHLYGEVGLTNFENAAAVEIEKQRGKLE